LWYLWMLAMDQIQMIFIDSYQYFVSVSSIK
jgi:hypothetical protein